MSRPHRPGDARDALTLAGHGFVFSAMTMTDAEVGLEELDPLGECRVLTRHTGQHDTLDRRVSWKGNASVERLIGQPVVLRFVMREADI